MDSVMTQKASKIAIKQVYDHIEERYLLKKENEVFMKDARRQMQEMTKESENLKVKQAKMHSQLEVQVNREVQLATLHLNASEFEKQANGVVVKERDVKILDSYVSKAEMKSIMNENKNSTLPNEFITEQIEVLHKQIKQLSVLLTEKLRQGTESSKGNIESQQSKQTRKNAILQNAI